MKPRLSGLGIAALVLFSSFLRAQNNPIPSLTTIFPNTASAGGPGFLITVYGNAFVANTVIQWNGSPRSTSVYGYGVGYGGYAVATILASDIATPGTAQVTVANPSPGGGVSNALPFTISSTPNPVPHITSIDPTSLPVGAYSGQIAIYGTGFVANSVGRLNGSDRLTAFINSGQLSMDIQGSDLTLWGANLQVTVFNPLPGGGLSNPSYLVVAARNPSLTSLSPNSVAAGSGDFTLTVKGSDFVPTTTVQWASVHGGSTLSTTFISSTQLKATVSAADVAEACIAQVWVNTPAPGGGDSVQLPFTIYNGVPAISSISPTSAAVNGPGFRLRVTGTGFVPESVVRWDGAPETTTFVSNTQLEAPIFGPELSFVHTAQVTVFNPSSTFIPPVDGGESNSLPFVITPNNPAPLIESVLPDSAVAGGGALALTVKGSGFISGSVLRWNGGDRNTTYVNSSQLQAAIPASDIASVGTALVAVFNPSPGGGTSDGFPFIIENVVTGPRIAPGGVANNAGYSGAGLTVAPGSIAAIFGSNLTDGSSCIPPSRGPAFSSEGLLQTAMAGAQVRVSGILAPMFYATPGQLGVQVPVEVSGPTATVQVTVGEQTSSQEVVGIAPVAPGIFTFSADGAGIGAITHADGSPCTPQDPAHPGEVVVMYATGLGQVIPSAVTGSLPATLSRTVASTTVSVDGFSVIPDFAGLSSCCVGLNQINFQVPWVTRAGNDIPIAISIGGELSNVALLPVGIR